MKKTVFAAILTSLLLSQVVAQNPSDALRYSRIFYGGTARFQGLGGAMGALGADYSVSATNPAGLGLYTKSEISLSPSIFTGTTSSEYMQTDSKDSRTIPALGNLGFVFTRNLASEHRSGPLKSITFAFGMNRQNDFNNRIAIEGVNNQSSMLTEYVNILNEEHLDPSLVSDYHPFDIGLAYNPNNEGLIFYDDSTHRYYCDAPNGGVLQQKSVLQRGSITEFEISTGINLNDQFYIGATIGVPSIRYTESSTYEEVKNDPSITYFQRLVYEQYLETRGTGFNFKLGVIYRPANWIRIGTAIHTPTFYPGMSDYWYSTMYGYFDNNGYDIRTSPDGHFDYNLMTPFRAIGSVAFIIGTYGLITGEYEYVNYNQSRFNSASDDFDDVNDAIRSGYTSPVNVRAGTEWRIMDFRVRGGFSYNGKPSESDLYDGERLSISGGLGYRGKHLFADMTYVWSRITDNYYLYDANLVEPARLTYTGHNAVMTVGVRF